MAEPIAQYKDNSPVINNVPVETNAAGYEAAAKVLGGVATSALSAAQKQKELKDTALSINATTSAYGVEEDTKAQIKTDPQNAEAYRQAGEAQLKTIYQAPIGGKQGLQAQSSITKSLYRINYAATVAQDSYAKNQIGSQFVQSWKPLLDDLMQSSGDEAAFRGKAEPIHANLDTALKEGVITPNQWFGMNEQFNHAISAHNAYTQARGDNNATPLQINHATSNPALSGVDTSGNPINPNTAGVMGHLAQDNSRGTAERTITSGGYPSPQVFNGLNDNDIAKLVNFGAGANQITAEFNNGNNWQGIKGRYDELKGKANLTQSERGELARADHLINGFTNGDFIGLISQTPQGQRIENTYNLNKTIDPQGALNNKISQYVAYGKSQKIDSHYIKPIPEQLTSQAQSGFILGSDPGAAVNAMNSLTPENRVYLSASLKDPAQQEVMNFISGNNLSEQQKSDLIRANQRGVDYSSIKGDRLIAEKLAAGTHTKFLGSVFGADSSKAQDTLDYIAATNPERLGSVTKSLTNYIKFQAISHNDTDLKHINDYVAGAVQLLGANNSIQSGTNYIFNNLNVSDPEAKSLANHLIETAYTRLHGSESDSNAYQMAKVFNLSANPLKVFNTPDNFLIVKDSHNTVLYSVPYNSSMVSHATYK